MYNAFWVGILIGVPVGAFAPGWVKPIIFVIALVLSDLVYTTTSHNVQHKIEHAHFAVPPWLIGVIGVGFGLWAWHYARKQGLKNLGTHELNVRWNNVRGVSRWGW